MRPSACSAAIQYYTVLAWAVDENNDVVSLIENVGVGDDLPDGQARAVG